MPTNLAYILPRAVIVLVGWGATYFILTALSTHLAPAVVYITGVSWVLAGIVCFGYLYKLRRELGVPQQRPLERRAGTRHARADRARAVLRGLAAEPLNSAVAFSSPARFQPRMRSP